MQQVVQDAQHPSPIELVRCFRQLRVLVIGDAMLDTYLEGKATRLCSEGPVPVVHKTSEQRIPGGAANTAANLRALEAEVALLGVVGRDIAGTLLRETLRARGIDDRWLIEDGQASTLHKLRILADGQYVVRFDEGGPQGEHSSPYTEATRQLLLTHLADLYAWCDVVLVSDYCYGVVSDALIALLQQLHAAHPKIWLIDSKALQRFRAAPATVVTPNYLEAQLFATAPDAAVGRGDRRVVTTLEDVARVAQRALSLLNAEYVAVTLAERGVFLLGRDGYAAHISAHPVPHANDVGAGDSFSSALALALAAGAEIEEAARIAIDAAAIAVTKQRTAVVLHQELLQRVSLRSYARDAQTQRSGEAYAARTRLTARLTAERMNGRTIVFTNGVFDILHAGHVQFLRQARELGDVLVVGVNSDGSTRRCKGFGRPINSERDRCSLVAALDMVDHVVVFDEDTPAELIRLLRPSIHVKGGDYADESLPEAEAVREVGGRVVILPLAGTLSTSNVIERIRDLTLEKRDSATSVASRNALSAPDRY
ncbi:MAG: D-glycero-beta-D-manno-heptose-7-phosphate kinase [Ktedonobacteraceae bacterium]